MQKLPLYQQKCLNQQIGPDVANPSSTTRRSRNCSFTKRKLEKLQSRKERSGYPTAGAVPGEKSGGSGKMRRSLLSSPGEDTKTCTAPPRGGGSFLHGDEKKERGEEIKAPACRASRRRDGAKYPTSESVGVILKSASPTPVSKESRLQKIAAKKRAYLRERNSFDLRRVSQADLRGSAASSSACYCAVTYDGAGGEDARLTGDSLGLRAFVGPVVMQWRVRLNAESRWE